MYSEIKEIILDYGEVLCVRPNEEHVVRMADVFGISQAQFATLYEKNRNAYDRGDLSPERYWSSFADELGISLHSDRIPHLRAWDVEQSESGHDRVARVHSLSGYQNRRAIKHARRHGGQTSRRRRLD